MIVAQKIEERRARDVDMARERRLRESGLARAYAQGVRTLDTLPTQCFEAVQVCQRIGTELLGAYLVGEAGSHKTSVAAAYLTDRINSGTEGRFVSVPDLFTELFTVYAANGKRSRADVIGDLVTVPALVLDDLGKERASEHAANVLFEILDGRYRNMAPNRWMIVTSELDIATLSSRFHEDFANAIARRLTELTVQIRVR